MQQARDFAITVTYSLERTRNVLGYKVRCWSAVSKIRTQDWLREPGRFGIDYEEFGFPISNFI